MMFLKKYIRSLIYCAAFLAALGVFVFETYATSTEAELFEILTRDYALIALGLLFTTLTPGLIRSYFPGFFLNSLLTISRRALGLSTFFFALLHASIAFFYGFGGSISAIFSLSGKGLLAIILGLTALFILFLMALTSSDRAALWLGPYWKRLHRLIYGVAILILFHTLLIGSHFSDPESFQTIFLQTGALMFIVLEVGATARRLEQTAPSRSEARMMIYNFLLGAVVFVAVWALVYSHYGHTFH